MLFGRNRKKNKSSLSSSSGDRFGGNSTLKAVVSRAYGYAEINRIREKAIGALLENDKKTILIVSPRDDTGNTFLAAVLGYSIAYFNSKSVLLVDLNMRRPQLHLPFGLEMEKGFTEIASDAINWKEAVKSTGLVELKVVTAGEPDENLCYFLNRPILKDMIEQMKADYEVVIFDSSPLLHQNRNNCDPVQLALICDMVLMVIEDKMTTKGELKAAMDVVINGGGTIDGVIYNRRL
ncbi:MAG: CpsD/CapB family tyrosine-protein kinase [Deltaproteobacteria bacterium]|nr:CpsD/CapB family tyrosine-protein kinase [Deltaproteobacteria bacterium]